LAADVLVLNHTLFFMHLGDCRGGDGRRILFKRVILLFFDEAHTVEKVASRHIGLSVSSRAIALRAATAAGSADEQGAAGGFASAGPRKIW